MQKHLREHISTHVTTSALRWCVVGLVVLSLIPLPEPSLAQSVKHAVLLQPAPSADPVTAEVIETRRKEVAELKGEDMPLV